jgi:maltose/moltooligosaccharide transporter
MWSELWIRSTSSVAARDWTRAVAGSADDGHRDRHSGNHRDLYGFDAGAKALNKSVNGLIQERVRYIDQRLVRGDPAQALLDAVGNNPANLIVVGNRGLGTKPGQLLGSVPGNVVKIARCDVLVVQTSALDEERLFSTPAAAAVEGGVPVPESGPCG